MRSTFPFARRLGPGLLATGIAVVFLASVSLAPDFGTGGCMESYPMQCPVIKIVSDALVGTVVGLVAAIALIVFASASLTSTRRTVVILVGFAVLAAVMVVGGTAALLHTTEIRY